MIEQYLPTIVIAIIGGLLGLVINGLKSEIKGMREDMKDMVTEKECDRRHEGIDKDLNNLGNLIRSK